MNGRLAVVVAVLVALAGCGTAVLGAGGSSNAPTETVTPIPVPSTDQPTKNPVDRPPGVGPSVGVDPTQLRRAHEAFLDDRSYEWRLSYNVSGESTLTKEGFTRRAVVDGDRFFIEKRDDRQTESLFVDETGGYMRTVGGNETRTDSWLNPGSIRNYIPIGVLIDRYLTGVDPTVTTVERDGKVFYRLHATSRPSTFRGARSLVTDYQVTAYVTPDGFVTSMAVSYDRTYNESRETVFFRFDYSDVGTTTLEEPDWVEQMDPPTPSSAPTRPPPRLHPRG